MEAPEITTPVQSEEEAAEELRQVIVELLAPPSFEYPSFTVRVEGADPFNLGCSSDEEVEMLAQTKPGFVSIDVDDDNLFKGLSADQTLALEMSAEQAEINYEAEFEVRNRAAVRDYFRLFMIVKQEAERAGLELDDEAIRQITTNRAIQKRI